MNRVGGFVVSSCPLTRARVCPVSKICVIQCKKRWRSCAALTSAATESDEESEKKSVKVGWLWESNAATTRTSLKKQGIRPKRSLGQNFVTDDGVLARIAHESGVVAGSPILEIGPGTGNLTRQLIAGGAIVTAIEKDDVLQGKIKEEFGNQVSVVHGDIMRVDLPAVIQDALQTNGTSSAQDGSSGKIRIVANLPYNITTECLQRLLPMSDCISHLCFMIQDEVALRLCNRTPGGQEYRSMSIFTHYYSDPTYKFKISKAVYFPEPKVDGALVEFRLKTKEERAFGKYGVEKEKKFLTMVNKSFGEKRKMIRNSLKPFYTPGQVMDGLHESGLKETTRAQELTLEDFVTLYNNLTAGE